MNAVLKLFALLMSLAASVVGARPTADEASLRPLVDRLTAADASTRAAANATSHIAVISIFVLPRFILALPIIFIFTN